MGCSVTASQKTSVFGSETSAACSCRSRLLSGLPRSRRSTLEASFEAVEARL